MSEQKTHAEIIDWMRKSSTVPQELADVLDAAHKREVDTLKQRRAELNAEVAAKDEVIKRLNDAISEEQRLKMATAENPSAVGNAAKLRETLSKFCAYSAVVLNTGMFNRVHLEALLNMAKAALAAPPRNCDVGTAEEQGKRFTAFCYKNRNAESCCGDCPAFNKLVPSGAECELTWAQMPYEEGGAK